MVDEVNLSDRSINAIARAFAEEIGGGGSRSNTIGGSGSNQNQRASAGYANSLIKGLTGFGAGLDRTFGQLDAGATGLSTFNGAVQGSTALFNKLITEGGLANAGFKKLADVVGVSTSMLSAYVQQVNILADAQLETYQNLSKVGGADQISGLKGVMDTFNRFGYTSKADFPKLTALIQENAESFAGLGGTVETGMKQFGNVSAILTKTGMQNELLLMGLKPEEINKSFAAMIKSVQLAGGSINNLGKTEEERARSVKEYIKQQDIITRLTGLTADQQQKAYDRAMASERYSALSVARQLELDRAEAAGDEKRVKELNLEFEKDRKLFALASKLGPDAVEGMADLRTGFVSEASQKLLQTIGFDTGEIMNRAVSSSEDINKLMVDVAKSTVTGLENYTDAFNKNASAVGNAGIPGLGFADVGKGRGALRGLNEAALIKALTESNKITSTPEITDPVLTNMVAVMQEAMRTQSAIMNVTNAGMRPISDLMVDMSAVMRAAAELVPGATPEFLKENEGKLLKMMQEQQGNQGIGVQKGTADFIKDLRTDANEKANAALEVVKETTKTVVDKTKEITGGFFTTITDFGQSFSDSVLGAATKVKEAGESFRNEIEIFKRSITPASSGPNVSFNSSSMSRLLADFRSSTGPNDNYRQSLVDTVYRPNAEDNDSRLAAASGALAGAGTDSNISREQMLAYETMIGQQAELIDLLKRSVGIQDKTLRNSYNT